ncbi:MAG: putative protease [Bradymonadia bacterium]|jgi:putative protease
MPLRPLPPNLQPTIKRRPELLAPVGNRAALDVAIAAGADAVYFGLDDGFNARARATNMSVDTLGEVTHTARRAGVRTYVTMNTLVFESELDDAARLIECCARSGIDALIVQDPAICLLAQQIAPELELHASTQMTISSAESAGFAAGIGVTRVVVPRELSVTEIADFAAKCDLELEVFIHGALCMSWSGQCLTSEAWGGRSANRGQCAQSCRMPYDLIVDGEHRDLGDVRYLLSPKDLAGYRAIPALMEIGVHTLKVEGRLKRPAYVSTTIRGLRRWVDAVEAGEASSEQAQSQLADDLAAMSVTYSRGFGDGFLAGADHQTLVDGRYPRHRGLLLGVVTRVIDNAVEVAVEPSARPDAIGVVASPLPALGGESDDAGGARISAVTPEPGMGVGFDAGKPEDQNEPGGPIFGVEPHDGGFRLRFGKPGPDLSRVGSGDRVWITNTPAIQRLSDKDIGSQVDGQVPITLRVAGERGAPMQVSAQLRGHVVSATSESVLAESSGAGINDDVLSKKLAGFGGTAFRCDRLDARALNAGLHLPVRELKVMRRALVEELDALLAAPPARTVAAAPPLDTLRAFEGGVLADHPAQIIPLCRTPEQLDAVIAAGLPEVELDWMELVGLGKAFTRAKAAGLRVTVATVRVQKPGEEGFDRRIAKLEPDGVLVRHWGAMMHFSGHAQEAQRYDVHGDFSLNVTNSLTAHHLLKSGLQTVTAAHDLDVTQLREMLDNVPAGRVTIVAHHHISTFHTEHCVYSHTLSEGRDYRTCGRPCDQHRVALRDHQGREHPVIVDVSCRNTVFNAEAQSAASLMPELLERGVRRFRVEFVWESFQETRAVLAAYSSILSGERDPEQALAGIAAHEQFGVTQGTMRVMRFG